MSRLRIVSVAPSIEALDLRIDSMPDLSRSPDEVLIEVKFRGEPERRKSGARWHAAGGLAAHARP